MKNGDFGIDEFGNLCILLSGRWHKLQKTYEGTIGVCLSFSNIHTPVSDPKASPIIGYKIADD